MVLMIYIKRYDSNTTFAKPFFFLNTRTVRNSLNTPRSESLNSHKFLPRIISDFPMQTKISAIIFFADTHRKMTLQNKLKWNFDSDFSIRASSVQVQITSYQFVEERQFPKIGSQYNARQNSKRTFRSGDSPEAVTYSKRISHFTFFLLLHWLHRSFAIHREIILKHETVVHKRRSVNLNKRDPYTVERTVFKGIFLIFP